MISHRKEKTSLEAPKKRLFETTTYRQIDQLSSVDFDICIVCNNTQYVSKVHYNHDDEESQVSIPRKFLSNRRHA